MNTVKEATETINKALRIAVQAPLLQPTLGTTKEMLETLLDIYTARLLYHNPQYNEYKDKRDIPEKVVIYLNDLIKIERLKLMEEKQKVIDQEVPWFKWWPKKTSR